MGADAQEREEATAVDGRGKVGALRASLPGQEAVGRDPGGRNPITGVVRTKMRSISHTLNTGGSHILYTIGDMPSLERFQDYPPNGK